MYIQKSKYANLKRVQAASSPLNQARQQDKPTDKPAVVSFPERGPGHGLGDERAGRDAGHQGQRGAGQR